MEWEFLNAFCANKTYFICIYKMAQLAIDTDARINIISSLYKVNEDEILWEGAQSMGFKPRITIANNSSYYCVVA